MLHGELDPGVGLQDRDAMTRGGAHRISALNVLTVLPATSAERDVATMGRAFAAAGLYVVDHDGVSVSSELAPIGETQSSISRMRRGLYSVISTVVACESGGEAIADTTDSITSSALIPAR